MHNLVLWNNKKILLVHMPLGGNPLNRRGSKADKALPLPLLACCCEKKQSLKTKQVFCSCC